MYLEILVGRWLVRERLTG